MEYIQYKGFNIRKYMCLYDIPCFKYIKYFLISEWKSVGVIGVFKLKNIFFVYHIGKENGSRKDMIYFIFMVSQACLIFVLIYLIKSHIFFSRGNDI